jgi:glycosyltransferase involved in cell wall biosynthesis
MPEATATSGKITGISAVIPVFNEPVWIGRCVAAVISAWEKSSIADIEVVIVDDGSDEATRSALAAVAVDGRITVIHQENAGRFAARAAGVRVASYDLVLLIDSRVLLDANALRFLESAPDPSPWNGHVRVHQEHNLFARFWNIVTEIAFDEYFGNPRTTTFGIDDFDRFPKGTGCFVAWRDQLVDAIDSFETSFNDTRHSSDDTVMLRRIASLRPINISPEFSCEYHARATLLTFLRHAYHRGIHFVDGYRDRGARFRSVVIAFPVISVTAVALICASARARRVAVLGFPLTILAVGIRYRRSWADRATLAALGPPWAVAFGLGIWRGIVLAIAGAGRR